MRKLRGKEVQLLAQGHTAYQVSYFFVFSSLVFVFLCVFVKLMQKGEVREKQTALLIVAWVSWAQKHSGTKREGPSTALVWAVQWGSQEEEDCAVTPLGLLCQRPVCQLEEPHTRGGS